MHQARFVVMLLWSLLAIGAVSTAGGCSNKLAKDRNKIRLVNEAFWSEVAAKNGMKAVDMLAPRTMEFFDSLVTHVQKSGPATLNKLSFFDRSMVLLIRNRMEPMQLRKLKTGKELGAWYFDGDFGMLEWKSFSLGTITITNNSARAEFYSGNIRFIDYKLEFIEQVDGWKFDWLSLVGFIEGETKKRFGKAKITLEQENKFLLENEREVSTKNTSPAIWEAPLK